MNTTNHRSQLALVLAGAILGARGAHAAPETWLGGGLGVRGVIVEDASSVEFQAELDVEVYLLEDAATVRLDLDYFVDPLNIGALSAPSYPKNPYYPEQANITLAYAEDNYLSAGLASPYLGVEDYDEWANYLPAHTLTFASLPGRIAGVDAGFGLDNAMTAWGSVGYDVDFAALGLAAGLWTEQESWATWSGVFSYPTKAGQYHGAHLSYETYPRDLVWVTLGATAALGGGEPLAGGYGLVGFRPEAKIRPTIRVEGWKDKIAFISPDTLIASAGARAHPNGWLSAAAEARMQWVAERAVPGLVLSASAAWPQPAEE